MLPVKTAVRALTRDDAARGETLTQQIGWSQTEDSWARMIRWGGAGSLCIERDGQLAATAIAIFYAPAVSWVGMVITHPDFQRQGLARGIMNAALDYLRGRGARCIMLDASQMGYRLYESMGFRSLYRVEVYGGTGHEPGRTTDVRDVTHDDLPGIVELDGKIFGVGHPDMIADLALSGQCWVAGEVSKVSGYLMIKASRHGVSVGPWYHHTVEGAETLLRRALGCADGLSIRVYIPDPNHEAKELAERYGLSPIRFTTRMALGDTPPGDMARQYGVASLGTG